MPPPKDPERYALWLQRNKDSHKGQNIGKSMPPRSEEWYRKQKESHLGNKASDETKQKMKAIKIGHVHSDETKKKISKSLSGRKLSEKTRKKLSNIALERPPISDETRKKLGDSHRGEKCYLWKGGISFEPYCPKFNNEFKERVRAFFDYTCPECGTSQNGKKLCVHHINFNKKTCCDGTIPMFVPLCDSCHGKTQSRRDYWKQHFIEMINSYYGGKCYFTIEEYQTLQQSI